MQVLWCWRCRMEVPMLDDEEFKIVSSLYSESFRNQLEEISIEKRFKEMLDYYYLITGFKETNPNAIMHHCISQYGPPCKNCGKPYRTSNASFCAACGNKRIS